MGAVAQVGGARVAPVRLTGDAQGDAEALRAAAGGRVDIAFDMVRQAGDAAATLAALNSLRRGGSLVLMGSMTVPIQLSYSDIMRNNLEIIGQFMYPAEANNRLIRLLRAGLLDISPIRIRGFPLSALPDAMATAADASNLDCVVVQP